MPPQGGVNARRAVTAAALRMDQPDILGQLAIGDRPLALGATAPGVVTAGRQAQDRAHHANRPDLTMLIDEPELHREAAPKMSAAFFRMSRSIRS